MNTKPYNEVVDDFVTQSQEDNSYWVKPSGVSYSKSYISKEGNMPYESAPLMKLQNDLQSGTVRVIDMWWPDDNNEIISLKETMRNNRHLLADGLNTKEDNVNFGSLWYPVASIMVNERKFAGTIPSLMRKMPDWMFEDILWKSTSRSAARVKRNTLDDYSEEERNLMLKKLADFRIKKASRDRQILGGTGDEECNKEFCPLYEIMGYDSGEEFIKDFKEGNVKTNHETWVALGAIIATHIYSKIHITKEDASQVKDLLKKNDIVLLDTVQKTVKDRMDFAFIDSKKWKIFPYNRIDAFYPTNVNRAIHDTRVQMLVNFVAMNTGQYENKLQVDGDAGEKTSKLFQEMDLWEKPEYDKNFPVIPKEVFETIETNALVWSKKLNTIGIEARDTKQLSPESEKFLSESMNLNSDSIWLSYRTIQYFLTFHNKKTELEELEQAFYQYVNRKKDENTWEFALFQIFKKYSHYENVKNIFPQIGSNSAPFFVRYLSQTLIVANMYGIRKGFSPDLYSQASSTTNETNTFGRSVSNPYADIFKAETDAFEKWL